MKKYFIFIFISLFTALFAETPLVTLDGVGTRSLGMGNNYTALANDYSAVFWNPAGLAFLPIREIHLSIGNNLLKSTSELNNTETDYTKNIVRLQSAGVVHSLPTTRGGFTLAFGYSSPYNLSEIERYSGKDIYIDQDSGLGIHGKDTLYYGDELTYDDVKYFANGWLRLWSAAAGWQVAEKFGFGITASLIQGKLTTSYSILSHTQNSTFDDGAESRSETKYTGVDLRLGGIYKINSIASLGMRLEFPQSIRFEYSSKEYKYKDKVKGLLHSSFSGALGGALTFPFATLTVDGYFRSPNPDIDEGDLAYWKVGAGSGIEIPIKSINTIIRAGYTWKEFDLYPFTEFINDILQIVTESSIEGTSDVHLITGGLTFIVSKSMLIDIAYSNTQYKTTMKSNDWFNKVDKKSIAHRGSITFSIRY